MIQVTRSLIRRLRSVFRRAGVGKPSATSSHGVLFQAGSDGLHIRAMSDCAAVEYHEPGSFDAEQILVPAELLAAAEGRTDDPITLDVLDCRVLATWTDGGIPQRYSCDERQADNEAPAFPGQPEELVTNPPELRAALAAAANVASRERARYALDCLQLRSDGKLVASDGRQLLAQGGFEFPGNEDLLVFASRVFGCRELETQEPLAVGLDDDWVAFRLRAWTIWLRIERTARFPKLDDLVRSPSAATARIAIDPADAQFLVHALPRLPSDHELNHPVTIELNGRAVVRARATGEGPPTELTLARSGLDGQEIRVNTDRQFLIKALQLGFREVYFFGPREPALCDDGRRQYLWALLDPEGAIRDSGDAVQVEAPAADAPQERRTLRKQPRFAVTLPAAQAAVASPAVTTNGASTPDTLIGQAVAMRITIREALGQTNSLIRALRREKRQSRLVASTLASLKQLQNAAG